jgi:hypothetical protein
MTFLLTLSVLVTGYELTSSDALTGIITEGAPIEFMVEQGCAASGV